MAPQEGGGIAWWAHIGGFISGAVLCWIFQRPQQLGLPVRDAMPSAVFQLMTLYSQPVRRQPSVEYVPHRYPREGRRRD